LLMNDRRKLESQRLETAQLRTVTRTAQMLAHDIRRPFSLLKATLDGLTQTETPEAMQELISDTVPGVKKSLDHLDGIIAELTNIGSPAAAEQTLFSIEDAVRKGVAIAAPLDVNSGRISIKILTQAQIIGVQNQIERVVANIISNALQAMGPNDRINVEARNRHDGKIEVTIANTGSYIAPEDLVNIFQPFFTKGKPDGTGLGLAICKRIIEQHGGVLTAASSALIGTIFTLLFPPNEPIA